jgi:hypothetical protein
MAFRAIEKLVIKVPLNIYAEAHFGATDRNRGAKKCDSSDLSYLLPAPQILVARRFGAIPDTPAASSQDCGRIFD